jgi:hypothetical protein
MSPAQTFAGEAGAGRYFVDRAVSRGLMVF